MTFLAVFICGLLSMPFLLLGVVFIGIGTLLEEVEDFITRILAFLLILLMCGFVIGAIVVIVQAVRENNGDLLAAAGDLVALAILLCVVLGILGFIVSLGSDLLMIAIGIPLVLIQFAAGVMDSLGNFCIGASSSLLGTILRRTQRK